MKSYDRAATMIPGNHVICWLDDTLHGSRARSCKENLRYVFKSQQNGTARNESRFMNTTCHASLLWGTINLRSEAFCGMLCKAVRYILSYVYDKYIITDSSSGILTICVSAVIHLFSFRH